MDAETLHTQVYRDDEVIITIDGSYSTDYSLTLLGWVLSRQALEGAEICVDGICVPIINWHPRPDVLSVHPGYSNENCGFVVQLPPLTRYQAIFKLKTQSGTLLSKNLSFDDSKPNHAGFPEGENIFNEFTQLVNKDQTRVLELGSRLVAPGSTSKRSLFSNASSYTGFDYYFDDNTDVVGDAHQLSSYFGKQRFDAIFSIAVFEHLAMPWLVAKEINRLLEIGGFTYHMTHNAWPIHEKPWDFWRFSDEALKSLFSPALGFELIKVGYFEPVQIHPERHTFLTVGLPTQPAFGMVCILARKTAEVNLEKFNWNVTVEEILGSGSHYPAPSQQERQTRQARQSSHLKSNSSSSELASQPLQIQLGKSQATVKRLRSKVKRLEQRLKASEAEIMAMQSSKFWRLRSRWFQFKSALGLQSE